MATRKPYPSDVSDEEWAFVAPYLALVREDAPQRNHELREVFNGLRWIVRTGSAWRYMPRHTIFRRGKPSTSRRGGGCLRTSSKRWSMICAYSCAFRKTERQIRRRPYSTLAPYALPLRAALGAAMKDTSTRRARRCTRGGGHSGTPARLVGHSGLRARAGSGGRVGGSCARGYRRVGRTGLRRPGLRWGTTGRRSGGSWHEIGGGQARRGQAGLRALATPLGRGARFRMGIAIQAVGEGLREATHRFGGVSLRRLRLPLPPAGNQHSRRGFITRSRGSSSLTASCQAAHIVPRTSSET